jgi:hypothetical protein
MEYTFRLIVTDTRKSLLRKHPLVPHLLILELLFLLAFIGAGKSSQGANGSQEKGVLPNQGKNYCEF